MYFDFCDSNFVVKLKNIRCAKTDLKCCEMQKVEINKS